MMERGSASRGPYGRDHPKEKALFSSYSPYQKPSNPSHPRTSTQSQIAVSLVVCVSPPWHSMALLQGRREEAMCSSSGHDDMGEGGWAFSLRALGVGKR